jgi:uncharacterized protein YfbU (UPF0304 family)
MSEFKLSKKDRLILANQFKILERLYPAEASYYEEHRTALEEGYELHYSWMFEHIFDGVTEAECRRVLDIMQMYSQMHFAYRDLDDKSEINPDDVVFKGFDGNGETSLMAYARYFMYTLNRFAELHREGDDLNTHYPTFRKYDSMLRAWNESETKYELTKEDLIRIINAPRGGA